MKKVWMLCLTLALLLPCLALAEAIEAIQFPAQTEVITGGNLPSGDLFYEYMLQQAGGRPGEMTARGTLARDNLKNDASKKVYDKLKGEIEDIANGTRTSTSIVVKLSDYTKLYWSAEDLGIESILVDNQITSEAMAAFSQAIQCFDLTAIIQALISDCPYSLYWYDKSPTGGSHLSSVSYYTYIENINDVVYLYPCDQNTNPLDEFWTFSLSVAKEYAAEENETSATAIQDLKVLTAVANAKKVVQDNARGTDFEKLTVYKEYILDAVEYNHDAVDNEGTPYGNPWQLIWVFDGIASTNVVCEGYSKAFQYLCDLTKFDGEVQCYSVTGTMGGGTGEGPHMWNLLNMDDGVSYVADITNSDTGSIGQDGELFMKKMTVVEGGYYKYINGNPITYAYDTRTTALWPSEVLIPSTEDYDSTKVPVRRIDIVVSTQPAKTEYIHGEAFDPAGMVVIGTYSNGDTEEIDDFTVIYPSEGQTYLKKGDTAVMISKGNADPVQVSVKVNAKALTLTGLEAVNRDYQPDDVSVALTGGALTGVVGDESVIADIPQQGIVETADAGENKKVTFPEIELTGEDADNYTLTPPEVTVTITPRTLAESDFIMGNYPTYTGEAIYAPYISDLVENADYTVTEGRTLTNVAPEAQRIIFSGKGNYQGNVELFWNLSPASLEDAQISAKDATFTGFEIRPEVVVTLGEKPLTEDDVDLQFADNINATGEGTAEIIVTGKGNYRGEAKGGFTIFQASLGDVTFTVDDQIYNGEAQKPQAKATLGEYELKLDEDYHIKAYKDNTDPGIATVVFEAVPNGNFAGQAEVTFNIIKAISEDITDEETAKLPKSLTKLSENALNDTGFRAIDLRDTACTEIGVGAFANCSALEVVYLPDQQIAIDVDAFDGKRVISLVGDKTKIQLTSEGDIPELDIWQREYKVVIQSK